jgi:hypothetical protein
MQDPRRDDTWKLNLLRRLLVDLEMRLGLKQGYTLSKKTAQGYTPLAAGQPIEGTVFIDPLDLVFETEKYLRLPLTKAEYPSQEQVNACLLAIAQRGKRFKMLPPDEKCAERLTERIEKYGADDTLLAADAFLRWYAELDGLRASRCGWDMFANPVAFASYLKDGRAWRKAEEAKQERERVKGEQEIMARKSSDWLRWLNVALLNPRGMTDEDRARQRSIQGDKANVQDLNPDDRAWMDKMYELERVRRASTKKAKLQADIARYAGLFMSRQWKPTNEQVTEFAQVRKLVDAASDDGPELDGLRMRLFECVRRPETNNSEDTDPQTSQERESPTPQLPSFVEGDE